MSILSTLKLGKSWTCNQVIGGSSHNAGIIAEKWMCCDICVEENKVCKCGCKIVDERLKVAEIDKDGNLDDRYHVKADSSFLHSVINMCGMLIGLGQLSTPYALENGGWASAFLLVGLGVACAYTSHLLGKCLKGNIKSKNYTDIGQEAFGTKGRVIAATLIYLEIFMALVSYTIALNDNLARVFSGLHLNVPWIHLSKAQILTVIAVLVALPSLWLRNLSSISFLSTAGILMSMLIFISVACIAAFASVESNHSIPVLKLNNIPEVSGLYIFSFAGHIVSIVSFSLVTMLYTSLAFMGAKLFGQGVSSQITLSMPRHLVATKIALWATVLTPMTKYALEFAPIALQLEHVFPSTMSSKMRMLTRGSIGSFLLLGILGLALSVPYFEHVLGLTGSLVSVSISIVFPCVFYIKIYRSQISKPTLALNLILVTTGVLLSIVGTIYSTKSLAKSMQRGHST
ncbi:hypothetical protein Sjap_009523 [Stephania japonica]|uniref:Amino acid transporter transmembrane domain-containing protein n=1 Tax=Stephania japonica TaxID=461633 RepID=A0AAP0JS52_9MAGN